VRVQGFESRVSVLCSNGLNVQVNIALRCHPDPDRLPQLHLKVGPDYLNKLVLPVTISSVRDVVGQYKPEELYSTASQEMQNAIMVEIIREIARVPLLIDSVVVESIELPDKIRDAIERKLEFQQILLAYSYRLIIEHREIERKTLEAEGLAKYNQKVRDSLSDALLSWQGIQATKELASSNNAKVVVIGNSRNGLPVILDMGEKNTAVAAPAPSPVPSSATVLPSGPAPAPSEAPDAPEGPASPKGKSATASTVVLPPAVDIPPPALPTQEPGQPGAVTSQGGEKKRGRVGKP
jgi:regulator of protease activity HflC (stomatin/prohibitin superfamily)